MKKLAFVVPLLVLAVALTGCRLLINYEGIEEFLTDPDTGIESLMTVQPENEGVTIILEPLPEFPDGLEGLSIYVLDYDPAGVPASELGTPDRSGIIPSTDTLDFFVGDLVNGDSTWVEVRGEIVGDTGTTYGYSGGFYPRPWGYGDYLGYDPSQDPDSSEGPSFDRMTGEPTAVKETENPDFYFSMDGGVLYVHGMVKQHDDDADEWLDVQDAPGAYDEMAPVHEGKIYHFKTADDHYGKFQVTGVEAVPAAILAGESIKTYLTYAFQTHKGVGNY